jgi:colanic acid biosynthesis protein WcaH
MFLSADDFAHVVKSTPLISIDLIVRNIQGNVLLGKRLNRPAQGSWFVPGGRVFKDEKLDDAFKRTVKTELGIDMDRAQSKFLGVYEHFYSNNVFNEEFSTHYIVLAYEISVDEDSIILNNQHSSYRWFDEEALLSNLEVYKYTKEYFQK